MMRIDTEVSMNNDDCLRRDAITAAFHVEDSGSRSGRYRAR